MLEHGELLRHDLFSYTRPDGPWVVFAWLFQCVAAALDQLGGLPLLTAAAALVFAGLPLVLYRRMLREGANIFVAFALSGVGYLGLVSHSHVRPHILTYLCFAVVVERLTAFERGRASAQSLLLLVPLMAIWVNVHGGFLVGLAVIALFFGNSSGPVECWH